MENFLARTWWLWMIILLFGLIVGVQKCSDSIADVHDQNSSGYNIVVIDGCEYLRHSEGYEGYMAHKGNCKFCRERNIQIIDSIIKANK